MQTEPPIADPQKRKRRWFQFRLRTLMVVVTLFCVVVGGYIGRQAKIVRDRKAFLEANERNSLERDSNILLILAKGDKTQAPSGIRIWLSDEEQECLLVESESKASRQTA